MTSRVSTVVVALTLGLPAAALVQSISPPVLERTKAFEDAVRAGDAAKVAACYAEDAVWIPPNGPRQKGRIAIEAHARKVLQESPGSVLKLTPRASEVSGDLAYVQGEFETTSKGQGGQPARERGNYIWILKNIKGQWLIVQDIFNSSEPPPKPPAAPKPPSPPPPPPKE